MMRLSKFLLLHSIVILLWTSCREEERTWVNRTSLVGLFEVEWKIACHNILVELLNNWKLDYEHNRIKVMVGSK
jgi:hypothetical protein